MNDVRIRLDAAVGAYRRAMASGQAEASRSPEDEALLAPIRKAYLEGRDTRLSPSEPSEDHLVVSRIVAAFFRARPHDGGPAVAQAIEDEGLRYGDPHA